jgi:hypothetical protein
MKKHRNMIIVFSIKLWNNFDLFESESDPPSYDEAVNVNIS